MKTFALAALAGVTSATVMTQMDYEYMKYISKFAKMYETVEEFERRKELFKDTHAKIEALNANEGSYRAAHNHMSDWFEEEYKKLLGFVLPEDYKVEENLFTGSPTVSSKDWREEKDILTDVKDQGQCGSCWAFSATESLESAYVIAGNDQVVMAP